MTRICQGSAKNNWHARNFLFLHKFKKSTVKDQLRTGKLETASAGAPVDDAKRWRFIDWKAAERHVQRLQVRIAKAVQGNRWGKVKTLQHLLTNSFYAKLLAVKRVTSNKGKKTPGVDGVLWKGARAKWRAAHSLRRRGYKPLPL